jgi:hypothetical protein
MPSTISAFRVKETVCSPSGESFDAFLAPIVCSLTGQTSIKSNIQKFKYNYSSIVQLCENDKGSEAIGQPESRIMV